MPEWSAHTLRDYALVADGERGALVGARGEITWLCFPRWDSPAVFAGLIGGGGGYAVSPVGRFVWGGYYEPGTLVWRNRWTTEQGRVECREAMALPGDPDRAVLLRRITARHAPATVSVRLALRTDFGKRGVRDLHCDDAGRWRGRLGDGSFCWSGAAGARLVRDGHHGDLELELHLDNGQSCDLVLALDTGPDADAPDADDTWSATLSGWHRRLPPRPDLGTAARDVQHAHAVLLGMTSSSGAMVAAATLGLPERARGGRNYDYRYAWIRDQCFVGQAAALGPDLALLHAGVGFVTRQLLEHGPDLAPAYRVTGEPVPDQTRLDLPGYPGGTDVLGNHVNSQFQLDAFGEALLLLAAADERDVLDPDGWAAVRVAVRAIEQRRQEPDAGVWELQPALWAQSRLQCAAGLRAIAGRPQSGAQAGKWSAFADLLVAEAGATCVHPSGRWQRAPDDPQVDAALLLPALRGAVPIQDPRTVATLQAVLDELVQDEFCYRFRHGNQPLAKAEGAFSLCGFLVALSLLQQGRHSAARGWFERSRAACGPPGLLTEEFDVAQRQLRGNLPQAFVHAFLIETAHRLDQDEHGGAASRDAAPSDRSLDGDRTQHSHG